MKKNAKKRAFKKGFAYWTPRVLSIIFVLFLAMMSLDVFDGSSGFWEIILGLLIHNIPTFILLAFLLISWKYEIVGAVAFFAAGILYMILILITMTKTAFEWYYVGWIVEISGTAFLIGIFWLVGWVRKRN